MLLLFGWAPIYTQAQQTASYKWPVAENRSKVKPYRLLTTGRQITIRSKVELASVMVWTSGGHRVFEQKDLERDEIEIQLTVPSRVYFIMIRLKNGESYSEKIGLSAS